MVLREDQLFAQIDKRQLLPVGEHRLEGGGINSLHSRWRAQSHVACCGDTCFEALSSVICAKRANCACKITGFLPTSPVQLQTVQTKSLPVLPIRFPLFGKQPMKL